jgi:hypothetical protein
VKAVILVAAAVLLCGCETGDGWVPGESPGAEQAAIPHTTAVAVRPAPVVVASAPLAAPAPVFAPPVVVAAPVVAPRPVASPAVEMADMASPSLYDEHCKAVAHQRAADARANGYSFNMADAVYDGTYKDCVIWDTQHGPGVSR